MRARFCMQCAAPLTPVGGRGAKACRRCGWTYWNNPKPTASIVIVDGRRVLLAKRAIPPLRGYWDLVGGFVEPGETAEEAARPEAREELGGEVDLQGALGTFAGTYGPGGIATLDVCYVARIANETGDLTAGDDVADVAWAPMHRLPRRTVQTARAAISRLRRLRRAR